MEQRVSVRWNKEFQPVETKSFSLLKQNVSHCGTIHRTYSGMERKAIRQMTGANAEKGDDARLCLLQMCGRYFICHLSATGICNALICLLSNRYKQKGGRWQIKIDFQLYGGVLSWSFELYGRSGG
ncbi:hypothetical protein [Bacteroides sp. UBA939]|uniref:hypothetical protein n=1 Tax=Bacteroides sp. UBA939 TaxID=1946092 RepID=UPI0025BC7571|nr:hypothetical protein [Bacteroides sp. UBA939]